MRLSTEKILAEVEGGIGWLTLNHPARRNAMSMEMWEAWPPRWSRSRTTLAFGSSS